MTYSRTWQRILAKRAAAPKSTDPRKELSTRAANALRSQELVTLEQYLAFLSTATLDTLMEMYGVGLKTAYELVEWYAKHKG